MFPNELLTLKTAAAFTAVTLQSITTGDLDIPTVTEAFPHGVFALSRMK